MLHRLLRMEIDKRQVMRILYVVHDFLPHNVAGTEIYAFNLAREVSKRHDIHVFYNIDRDALPGTVVKGVYEGIPFSATVSSLGKYNEYAPTHREAFVIKTFEETLNTFSPDIVHFHHILHLTPQLLRIVHRRKIPIIFTLHDFWLLCHRTILRRKDGELCIKNGMIKCGKCHMDNTNTQQIVDRLLQALPNPKKLYWQLSSEASVLRYYFDGRIKEAKEIFRLVDLFISPSNFLRDVFIQHGLDPSKIIYSGNGMPEMRTVEFEKNSPKKRLQFGYMGGDHEAKGFQVLLRAFSGITAADLLVFGRVAESKQKAVSGVGASHIHFHGQVTGGEKELWLSRMDAMIVPSLSYETFSLVVHEAYMAGMPAIVSGIGALAEFVKNDVTGLHFKVGNSDDLREKILLLVQSPDRIDEMRKNLPRVKTIPENAVEMDTIYGRLAQGCK